MRGELFVIVESVFLGLGLLAFTPSGNPTTTRQPSIYPSVQFSVSATPPIIPSASKTVGPPKVLRVWECVASWYGEDLDGRPTATGEIYDMCAATAAHPALPLGSIVRVVNTRNHRSQVVRINDRGPYVGGRELDVSYEVARRLDFDQTGVASVRMLRFSSSAVEATIRFPVDLQHAAETDERVSRELLKALDREPKLKLAASGSPSIRLRTDLAAGATSS